MWNFGKITFSSEAGHKYIENINTITSFSELSLTLIFDHLVIFELTILYITFKIQIERI